MRQYFQVMGLRVTLDTNINYINFNEGNENKYDQRIVLECKTQNLKNINYIDQSFEFEKIRFSKYCNSIENLNII